MRKSVCASGGVRSTICPPCDRQAAVVGVLVCEVGRITGLRVVGGVLVGFGVEVGCGSVGLGIAVPVSVGSLVESVNAL